jgi:transcriptional regulator with XRE-family HTH domain
MVNKITKSDFAILLRRLLEKRGLTAEGLAKKAKINRTYISKIENKNYLPSYDVAEKICGVLKSDKLMSTYMHLKYPKATTYLSGSFEKDLYQAISRMIIEGKTKDQIVDHYIDFMENRDPKIVDKLVSLIDKLENIIVESTSLTDNIASSLWKTLKDDEDVEIEHEDLPYFLANPKKHSK